MLGVHKKTLSPVTAVYQFDSARWPVQVRALADDPSDSRNTACLERSRITMLDQAAGLESAAIFVMVPTDGMGLIARLELNFKAAVLWCSCPVGDSTHTQLCRPGRRSDLQECLQNQRCLEAKDRMLGHVAGYASQQKRLHRAHSDVILETHECRIHQEASGGKTRSHTAGNRPPPPYSCVQASSDAGRSRSIGGLLRRPCWLGPQATAPGLHVPLTVRWRSQYRLLGSMTESNCRLRHSTRLQHSVPSA